MTWGYPSLLKGQYTQISELLYDPVCSVCWCDSVPILCGLWMDSQRRKGTPVEALKNPNDFISSSWLNVNVFFYLWIWMVFTWLLSFQFFCILFLHCDYLVSLVSTLFLCGWYENVGSDEHGSGHSYRTFLICPLNCFWNIAKRLRYFDKCCQTRLDCWLHFIWKVHRPVFTQSNGHRLNICKETYRSELLSPSENSVL